MNRDPPSSDDSDLDSDASSEEDTTPNDHRNIPAAMAAIPTPSDSNRNKPSPFCSGNWGQGSPASSSYRHNVQGRPHCLPQFDQKVSIHVFFMQFEAATREWEDLDKGIKLINSLDPESAALVLPRIASEGYTYRDVKQAIIDKFGINEHLTARKRAFLMIKFKENKTISKFAEQFHLEAQILKGSRTINNEDAQIAMENACMAHSEFFKAMLPAFNIEYDAT